MDHFGGDELKNADSLRCEYRNKTYRPGEQVDAGQLQRRYRGRQIRERRDEGTESSRGGAPGYSHNGSSRDITPNCESGHVVRYVKASAERQQDQDGTTNDSARDSSQSPSLQPPKPADQRSPNQQRGRQGKRVFKEKKRRKIPVFDSGAPIIDDSANGVPDSARQISGGQVSDVDSGGLTVAEFVSKAAKHYGRQYWSEQVHCRPGKNRDQQEPWVRTTEQPLQLRSRLPTEVEQEYNRHRCEEQPRYPQRPAPQTVTETRLRPVRSGLAPR